MEEENGLKSLTKNEVKIVLEAQTEAALMKLDEIFGSRVRTLDVLIDQFLRVASMFHEDDENDS